MVFIIMTSKTDNQIIEIREPWWKGPSSFILAVIIVTIALLGLKAGVFSKTITIFGIHGGKETPDPKPLPLPEPNRFDVLILGVQGFDKDSIENAGGLLTDTIMILSVDKETKRVSMTSIPRDLYVDLVGGKGKLNEAYERGLAAKKGLNYVKETMSRITGVYIDKVLIFDMNAFKTIVDYLGGVDIYLDRPFSEPKQWTYPFDLPAGENHIDGQAALYYARSRFSSSDFDRARRQQQLILAIKKKASSTNLLSDPTKVVSVFLNLKSDIVTDFQVWDINDIFTLAKAVAAQKGNVKEFVMSTDNVLYQSKSPSGEFILLPNNNNYQVIQEFMKNSLTN